MARRYMPIESLAKTRVVVIEGDAAEVPKEVIKEIEEAS